jgi:histidine ammonia-lyase
MTPNRHSPGDLILADQPVELALVSAAADRRLRLSLSEDTVWRERLEAGRKALEAALSAGHPVYGVSTGVGMDAARRIKDPQNFAYQIIRQHGCGLGEFFSPAEGRAILFTRLVSLAKGYSAVRPTLLQALCDLIDRDVIPRIPSLGSVGASGDLTPLSYVAAVLAGEREVYYRGEILPAKEALNRAGLSPHDFAPKESLAIMNGTSVMTAVGALACRQLGWTLRLCERATALALEILYGRSLAFHPQAHRCKDHPGQITSAETIRTAIQGSGLVDCGPVDAGPVDAGPVDRGKTEGEGQAAGQASMRIIQDPYSLRCAPQVIGASRDALSWAETLLSRELNSVNDNPLVDPDEGTVIFAGNFYGGHVALAMDLVKTAAASVADLIDRQFALLVDRRLNIGLPENLVGYGGCGLKALQLTTSALTARCIQRAAPDTLLSRPTEVHNQDKVSMGLNAALSAAEVTDLLQQVLATQLVALSNAASLRSETALAPAGRALVQAVRAHSAVLDRDRRLDGDLRRLKAAIETGSLMNAIR